MRVLAPQKMNYITILNRRLAESLGYRGAHPRFKWLYAPEEKWFTFDTDDRTILKKTWADRAAPDGGLIGRAWLLAEWRRSKVFDHMGFGDGIRIPFIREYGYEAYMETAIPRGQLPTEELTANYIFALRKMIDESAEMRADSFQEHLADEKYTSERNSARERDWNRERAAEIYDNHTGAFGNCDIGQRDGYFSFQNQETGDKTGFFTESPLVRKLQEADSSV
jgi:hypothetical protein